MGKRPEKIKRICINYYIYIYYKMSTVTFSGTGTLTQAIVNASIGSATIVVISGYSSIGQNAFNGKI